MLVKKEEITINNEDFVGLRFDYDNIIRTIPCGQVESVLKVFRPQQHDPSAM